MELHSPIAAKKLWNLLRVAFFMMRKGLISKRKLIMNMNLLMKRGKIMFKNKNLSTTLLAFPHHHHHPRRSSYGEFSIQEYEFSCSNSPNPVFFHTNKRRNYFPCLNVVVEGDETPRPGTAATCDVPRIEYSPSPSLSPQCMYLASGEAKSPLSVRISNFSEEEDGVRPEVDVEAEEFIRLFYEQLRVQSRTALIQYEEKEVQQMLARGH